VHAAIDIHQQTFFQKCSGLILLFRRIEVIEERREMKGIVTLTGGERVTD
jgi:hypothetical protein